MHNVNVADCIEEFRRSIIALGRGILEHLGIDFEIGEKKIRSKLDNLKWKSFLVVCSSKF